MAALLRPPVHRGPLLASGAVVLAVGIALVETRMADRWATGWHLVLTAAAAGLYLWLGARARPPAGRPAPHQSVLYLLGLLMLVPALGRLADVLGADFSSGIPSGTLTWTLAVLGGVALLPAVRDGSAAAGFVAALAFGGALLAAVRWIFEADAAATYRWLLLLLAVTYAVVSLVLRGGRPRQAELLVCAAGVAILAIAVRGLTDGLTFLFGFSLGGLPAFWDGVVLAAGLALVALAAADRAPGPAYLGALNLAAFVALVTGTEATLAWWPLVLLGLGTAVVAAALRPARPLPPEPDPYPVADLPPRMRAGERELTVRVRKP